MSEIIERSLVHLGLKHYFLVDFPQQPGALRTFLDSVLGPEDDITYFEYVKRSNRDTGPALVGVELGNPGDYPFLLQRIAECGMTAEEVAALLVAFPQLTAPTATSVRYTVAVADRTPFRLPSGFESDRYRVKLTGSGRFCELQVAQSFRELAKA